MISKTLSACLSEDRLTPKFSASSRYAGRRQPGTREPSEISCLNVAMSLAVRSSLPVATGLRVFIGSTNLDPINWGTNKWKPVNTTTRDASRMSKIQGSQTQGVIAEVLSLTVFNYWLYHFATQKLCSISPLEVCRDTRDPTKVCCPGL